MYVESASNLAVTASRGLSPRGDSIAKLEPAIARLRDLAWKLLRRYRSLQ